MNLVTDHDDGAGHPPAVLLSLLRRPAWHALAACRGEPVELFFPEPGPRLMGRSSAVRTLCAVCPVRRPCADAGLDESEGIWGGAEPDERLAWRVSAAVIEHASLA